MPDRNPGASPCVAVRHTNTIIPEPGNPLAWDRYAYGYSNPVKYIDPSGHLSEEKIQEYFGVSSWEEVLAYFEKGGSLENHWGLLEALRHVEIGDIIGFFSSGYKKWSETFENSTIFSGVLFDKDGQLFVHGGGNLYLSLTEAVKFGENIFIDPLDGGPNCFFKTNHKYNHLHFDPGKVDWAGVGLDAGGIIADVFSFGVIGRFTNYGKLIKTSGELTGAVISEADLIYGGFDFWKQYSDSNLSWRDYAELTTDMAGVFFPIAPDAVGLFVNFSNAIYVEP